ncbi:isoleucine--tRNA ligase [Terriglobus roseus]|uniref:Isoleucine--tRNA ligase n=1 Tax=Terriglobus roseus TaxID=392734 RepID=A0A1H4ITG0_9BACT|nr:isoleucine--tRNA ligase [Terriglobus roseus]SEB37273.1 Isoleucyl-tRNA synthetase [Terriglobus roseus]
MDEANKPKQLKDTLNLPKTAFPMKANLPGNEPARLQAWTEADLYGQIRASRAGKEKFILHDGPPYANGAIHLGHALNKCIKDFVVKSKTMAGFDAPYVPGWDCHGLPIEIKVDEQLGRKKLEMDALTVRQQCRDYAQKYVDLQRSQFVRMGVLGRWDNPYLTMSFGYEARILETFYAFFEKGFVYKGLRPVYWCMHDKTALAEAEVEYEMHTSPSVYVRYALTSDAAHIDPSLAGLPVFGLIWTTTPWTLPASLAIAFHPEFEYVAVQIAEDNGTYGKGNVYLVASELLESLKTTANLPAVEVLARFHGEKLERTTFAHPFLPREILGVMAEYVTTEQGTGGVHTAPAHGPDDFATGKKYALSQVCDVDEAGRLRNGLPEYDSLNVHKANAPIIELLKSRGALMAQGDVHHSYPHCWRCHRPVIYRATEQWFIGMETPLDGTTFRERALAEIAKVTWDPSWGQERISNMIATRPDWCISRQRIWGVPIAVFLCQKCHEPMNDPAINASVVKRFESESADAWYRHSAEDLLPAGTACAKCGGTEFRKEMDILDVWFESGASWHAVLEAEPELQFPADMYTEGGDQHRGWFHSSLLSSVGIRDQAPYKYVATSGWTLDEQRRAFSKSLGNGVDPVKVMDELGGDIVRLWVASVDFREDVIASVPLMKRLAEEIYRKLRNTFRFLLANLDGFVPAEDEQPWDQMEALDQYMLARTSELVTKVRASYDAFEFHRVFHALNEFCNSELSAFYLDVLKDRLYTLAPKDTRRLSAQTAVWKITEALVRLIAPILSFTADEIWSYMPPVEGREASVHIAHFPSAEDFGTSASSAELLSDILQIRTVRESALKVLEAARAAKTIGKALEARIVVTAPKSELATVLSKHERQLPELFGVSQVELAALDPEFGSADTQVEFAKAEGTRCDRCWRYTDDVGAEGRYPTVCARCADALEKIGYESADEVSA